MAKVQTRRSVSVSKNAYEKLSKYAEENGCSKSGVVERLILALTSGPMSKVLDSILHTQLVPKSVPGGNMETNYGYDTQTLLHRKLYDQRFF